MEEVDLDIDNNNAAPFKSSTNFGSGIEMLMNDKRKSSSNVSKMNLGDLDDLERELNELSGNTPVAETRGGGGGGGGGGGMFEDISNTFSSFLGATNLAGPSSTERVVHASSASAGSGSVGSSTKDSMMSSSNASQTWDGFAKLSEVPLATTATGAPKLSERERRRKKRAMIKKLEEWYEKGLLKHASRFNMDSDYDEIEDEYETALDEKRKKDSVKLQGWWFMTFVNSIEYANSVFNPFDLNLDGWGEQISEDIDSYDEIFTELHDKYKGGKISPEISILLRMGFSAAVVNITNKALSTATPGFNDIIKQSPELMKMFTNATVQSMTKESQGGGGGSMAGSLMNGLLGGPSSSPFTGGAGGGGAGGGGGGLNNLFGPPPKPVETQTARRAATGRPDVFFSGSVSGSGVGVRARPSPPPPPPSSSNRPDLVAAKGARVSAAPSARAEMRGPQKSDLDEILSGLKMRENTNTTMGMGGTKTREGGDHASMQQQQQQQFIGSDDHDEDDDGDDNLSVTSLLSIGKVATGFPHSSSSSSDRVPALGAAAKAPRKRQKSDRNIVALDI